MVRSLAFSSALLCASLMVLSSSLGCDSEIVETGGGGSTSDGGNGAGTSNGGAGGECAGFDDAPSENSVTLRFTNNDFQPIYLPGTCSSVAYTLSSQDGAGATYPYDPSCLQTCQELQTEGQLQCDACAPILYKIEPGQSLEVTWDGTGLVGRKMPQACLFDQFAGEDCSQIVRAPNGEYDVEITAYSDCGPDCMCDAGGQCYGSPSGLSAASQPASIFFPMDTEVDITWEGCSFGCPAGDGM